MMNAPKTIEEFTNLKPWWKTPVSTRVVLSDDGVADLLRMLEDEGRRPFFVADKALAGQPEFARIFAEKNLFAFDATFSELCGKEPLRLRRDLLRAAHRRR